MAPGNIDYDPGKSYVLEPYFRPIFDIPPLVQHPDQPRPEITEMDYGIQDGMLRIKLRAATAGYILRKWSVDCSPDHSLRGHEYRLWLKDQLAI